MNDIPEKGATAPLNFGGSSPFTNGTTEPLADIPATTTDHNPVAEPVQEAPGTPTEEAPTPDADQTNETVPADAGEQPVTASTETETAPVAEADASSAEPLAETQPEQVGEVTTTTIEQEESTPVVPADASTTPAEAIPTIVGKTDDEIEADIKARDALNAKIEDGQKAQRQDVIAQIKKVVETYKIPLAELGEALGIKGTRKGSKAKPKYKDPASDKTWSGRGKEPLWIKGKDRKDFLITA